MSRQLHPITRTILESLEHDGAGSYVLKPEKLARVRAALDAEARSGALRDAVVAVIEVAYMLETERGATQVAVSLRALASQTKPALRVRLREVHERRAGEAGDRHARFTALMGGPRRVLPVVAATGLKRVADLAPPRIIR